MEQNQKCFYGTLKNFFLQNNKFEYCQPSEFYAQTYISLSIIIVLFFPYMEVFSMHAGLQSIKLKVTVNF